MNFNLPTVMDIRDHFEWLLEGEEFVTDKTGVKTIEISPVLFEADEVSIFGNVNWDYVKREIKWYDSQSLLVEDIPGKTPEIWKKVCDSEGMIHSNYGHLIYSDENFNQYENVVNELQSNPDSRRAVMIYNRPSMHYEYNEDGMSDFICTNAVQYLIREGEVHAIVQMRSNDAVFGYKNDRAWQDEVLYRLSKDLDIPKGRIFWHVGSLHVYERHFNLVKEMI